MFSPNLLSIVSCQIVMESGCSSTYARTPDLSGCFQTGAALEVAGQSGGVVAAVRDLNNKFILRKRVPSV